LEAPAAAWSISSPNKERTCLHGSAYDLAQEPRSRRRQLDQRLPKRRFGKDTYQTPTDTQNDFGASVGGPVRVPWLYNGKDKTFFFFNYEGFRQVNGGTSLLSAPTQAMLGGDFSSLLTPMTVGGQTFQAHILYDYSTCTGANQGQPCQAYPNNKITEAPDPVFAAASEGYALRPLRRHQPLLQHQ
jgi:hypothetical protein